MTHYDVFFFFVTHRSIIHISEGCFNLWFRTSTFRNRSICCLDHYQMCKKHKCGSFQNIPRASWLARTWTQTELWPQKRGVRIHTLGFFVFVFFSFCVVTLEGKKILIVLEAKEVNRKWLGKHFMSKKVWMSRVFSIF